ncbi:MAG TPA: hypothetical protein DEG43_09810, partial [Acidimicrobiaceae bacterium]|nr:hypothetical protein [Acidimicrobiaceae bacterium]
MLVQRRALCCCAARLGSVIAGTATANSIKAQALWRYITRTLRSGRGVSVKWSVRPTAQAKVAVVAEIHLQGLVVPQTDPAEAWEEPAVAWEEPAVAWEEPVAAWEEPAVAWEEPAVAWEEPAVASAEPAAA